MFALVDCNSFYASCEQVFRPDLRGQPVVVLSNNDGCIVARSAEAKKLGVPMGEPVFKIANFLKERNVAIFSSNYPLYGDMSERVMNTLRHFTPDVEVYSIDEAFLYFPKTNDAHRIAANIHRQVRQWTGIPVSVGMGPTKTLAKIANHIAKRWPGYQGICVLKDMWDADRVLGDFPVGKIWGIGRQYKKFLLGNGIETALQLRSQPESWLRKHLTVVGARMAHELRGTPCIDLEIEAPPRKGICTARTFGQSIEGEETLSEAVASFAANCALKLRKQKCCTNMVSVFIHTNYFRQDEAQYCNHRTITLPVATSSTAALIRYALTALGMIYRPGHRYKKAGVMITNIVPNQQVQGDLFYEHDEKRDRRLMEAVDDLNQRFGRSMAHFAAEGIAKPWGMRQGSLSPRYTTRWGELRLC